MVYLNFNNLDVTTQQRLLYDSKQDAKREFGKELKKYTLDHFLNYDSLLDEEAQRNLYSCCYVFNL